MKGLEEYSRMIAKRGIEIGAIRLRPDDPFEWASGYRMPIYNDNRMFLFNPNDRRNIKEGLRELIKEKEVPYDIIAGTSTAGIPHAEALADCLYRPMIYIRDKPKSHGLMNQIEGIDANKDLEQRTVLVIEDLISTGGSSARAVQAVRDANGKCNSCISIFDYGLRKAVDAFKNLDPGCETYSLLTYDTLMQTAQESNKFTAEQIDMLKEWKEDPFNWGEKHGFAKVEK